MKVEKSEVDAILAQLVASHHHFPGTREIHVVLSLPPTTALFGGFVLGRGHSSCLNDKTFVLEKGIEVAEKNARIDAENRAWEYLGLFKLFNASLVSGLVHDKSDKTTIAIED